MDREIAVAIGQRLFANFKTYLLEKNLSGNGTGNG
jgi:hypothetical protein